MISRNILRREDFRFELRPYETSFATGIFEATTESRNEIVPWMAWAHANYSPRDAEVWVEHCINAWDSQREYEFAIFDREDSTLTGSCGLNNINRKDMMANLGYWVRTSKTRLGAAVQAALLLRDFGLQVVGFNRLEIVVSDGDTASRRVAEKVGAIYEGLQRRRVNIDDRVHDAHMYALIDEVNA